jgi:hypothetical protein
VGDNLIDYIEKFELLIFFSGYPLVYSLVYFIHGQSGKKQNAMLLRVPSLLPFAYALTASVFLSFWLREKILEQQIQNFQPHDQISYIRAWGLAAVLFWIPVFNKKPYYSLLHSLVFFFIFFKDLVTGIHSVGGREIIRNEMKIYTISLALNITTLILVFLVSAIIKKMFPRQ